MATAKAVLRNIDFSIDGDTADTAIYAPQSATPQKTREISSAVVWKPRSEEHTSELQSLMRISYDVFCLNIKQTKMHHHQNRILRTRMCDTNRSNDIHKGQTNT